MRILLWLVLVLALPALGQEAETYVFPGRVKSRAELSLVVEHQGKAATFRLDELKLDPGIQPGSRVVVYYQETLDADVLQATRVVPWPIWRKMPAPTGPLKAR